MRYATVKTVSKPMVGFYFSEYNNTKKNHIEKQLKHQNETEGNKLKLERKRKMQQPPPSHGLVINSNKTALLPKRACSDADVTCHCQIETRFYPCLLTSHTQ